MKTLRSIIFCAGLVFLASPGWTQEQEVVPCRQTGDVTNEIAGANLTDALYLLNYLFFGGPEPAVVFCQSPDGSIIYPPYGSGGFAPEFENGNPGNAADVNGDGTVNLTDALVLLNWLFVNGPEPPQMHCVSTDVI